MPQGLLFILILLSFFVLIKYHKYTPSNFYTLLLFSAVIGYTFSTVSHDNGLSLFFPPYGFAVVAGWNYAKYYLRPIHAAAFIFISEIITDITWAAQFGNPQDGTFLEKIRGVGGAGFHDGIVLIPLAGFLLQIYCKFRSKDKLKAYGYFHLIDK